MKIIVISDVHGRSLWKKQVNQDFDHCIFLGDYFDSFDISGTTQYENFNEILRFKRMNSDRVTLLAGNHDISYLDSFCQCSGYQNGMAYLFKTILEPLIEDNELLSCKVIDNYLFSHAGITKTWFNNYGLKKFMDKFETDLETAVNSLFKKDVTAFCFQNPPANVSISGISHYGNDIWQSPMWIRPPSLCFDKIPDYIQVVGHTQVQKPTLESGVWFCDCQENTEEILILNL